MKESALSILCVSINLFIFCLLHSICSHRLALLGNAVAREVGECPLKSPLALSQSNNDNQRETLSLSPCSSLHSNPLHLAPFSLYPRIMNNVSSGMVIIILNPELFSRKERNKFCVHLGGNIRSLCIVINILQ